MSHTSQDKIHGRRTAYAFYVQSCRQEYERNHPDEPPNFTLFIQNCLTKWNQMSVTEKTPFKALAEEDKIRYNNELQQYGIKCSDFEEQHHKKRKPEEPTKLKQPLSAFFWYCNDQRSIVQTENPSFSQGEVAVEMGQRWIAAPPAIKQKYEEIAEKEVSRYEQEKEANKRKQ